MDILFSLIFFFSTLILLIINPDNFLSSLLKGAGNAATLSIAFLSSYAVWLGVMQLWEKCGITHSLSRLLKKPIKKLFRLERDDTAEAVCMNLSANFLGIGSAATPYGIEAARLMETEKNCDYSSSMLFVINATSIQLIPTSIIALRTALNSSEPTYVILPTLLVSLLSCLFSIVMIQIFLGKKNSFHSFCRKMFLPFKYRKNKSFKNVGTYTK